MFISNLTIANIFLFLAILCMVLSAAAALPLYFVYSIAATAMAGAVRYNQLPDDQKKPQRH
jgi:Mg2+/citrate symporter